MARRIDPLVAIDHTPREIVEAFRRAGYRVDWNWWESWYAHRADAYDAFKVYKLRLLEALLEAIDEEVDGSQLTPEGLQFVEGSVLRRLLSKLMRKGFLPTTNREITKAPLWRLRSLVSNLVDLALDKGRWINREERQEVQYLQYKHVDPGLTQPNSRPHHAALHNKVFRADDIFWGTHAPPNGWGCRCWVKRVTINQINRYGWNVESGEGKLFDFTQLVGKRNPRPVNFVGYDTGEADENGQPIVMAPDAGYNFNPGNVESLLRTASLKPWQQSFYDSDDNPWR